MFHKGFEGPVLIKKIYLNIWTLRDEVESLVQERGKVGKKGEILTLPPREIVQIRGEYTSGPQDGRRLRLVETEEEKKKKTFPPSTTLIQKTATAMAHKKVAKGICVISEIDMYGLYFISGKRYPEGQSIILEFLIPKKFTINAEITACRAFNPQSRIIRKNKLQFRVSADFTFLRQGERTLLREFLLSLAPVCFPDNGPQEEKKEEDATASQKVVGLDFESPLT